MTWDVADGEAGHAVVGPLIRVAPKGMYMRRRACDPGAAGEAGLQDLHGAGS